MFFLGYFLTFALAILFPLATLGALEKPGEILNKEVGVFTQLGAQVDIDTELTNSRSEVVRLGGVAPPGKPLIVVPVYFKCPRLCGLIMDGVINLINGMNLRLGEDYGIAAISFDPTDTPTSAADEHARNVKRLVYGSQQAARGLNFLVGEEDTVSKLMNRIGFHYRKDGVDFAHSAAIMILTPTGVISQYFTGIEFSPWDVRLALVEASKGAIGSPLDHFLLFCYRFDPTKGRYTWAVLSTLKVGGAMTLIGLAALYIYMFRSSRRSANQGDF